MAVKILVQEADGNFFESFTALSWKQENRRLRANNEEEQESDKPPPVESHIALRPDFPLLSRKDFESLYIELLYTIKHRVGTTSDGHSPFEQELFSFAEQAFHVTEEQHEHFLAKASEEQSPTIILNVTVIGAKDLDAKDANGYSDPYCMLGIMPGAGFDGIADSDEEKEDKPKKKMSLKHRGSKKDKQKNKSTSVRDQLPAKFIKVTEVKRETLNPVWNEKFQL
ncbi:BAI1-associated protein 3-like [Ptychodera flava]|uniref:BAI1-associated protein 3-like n=1 Tax=Ptychodera flava TaxID=63121 RepID=UPI003969C025